MSGMSMAYIATLLAVLLGGSTCIFIVNRPSLLFLDRLTGKKAAYIIFSSFLCLLGYFMLWGIALHISVKWTYPLIAACTLTFINRCAIHKKSVAPDFYNLCFPIEALVYAVEVTALFGRTYLQPVPIEELTLQDSAAAYAYFRECFNTGLTSYFILFTDHSFDAPHLIQLCFGVLMVRIIAPTLIKIVVDLISPKDKPKD